MLNFTSIKPKYRRFDRAYLGERVRVSFSTKQNKSFIRIYIGQIIAKKFGLQSGDRVILLADGDERLLQLKRDNEGFKLGKLNNQLVLQASWPYEASIGTGQRFVTVGMRDGNLEIVLPPGKYENVAA